MTHDLDGWGRAIDPPHHVAAWMVPALILIAVTLLTWADFQSDIEWIEAELAHEGNECLHAAPGTKALWWGEDGVRHKVEGLE